MDYSDLYIIDEVEQPTKFDLTADARKAIKAYFKSIGQKCTIGVTDVGRCQFIKVKWVGGVTVEQVQAIDFGIKAPFELYPIRYFGNEQEYNEYLKEIGTINNEPFKLKVL